MPITESFPIWLHMVSSHASGSARREHRLAENARSSSSTRDGVRIVDEVKTGRDVRRRSGVRYVHDVALRTAAGFRGWCPDRRGDGAASDDGTAGPTELVPRLRDGSGELLEELRERADRVLGTFAQRHHRDQALTGASTR